MNLEHLQTKLTAAARAHPPATNVPYAFEQRIMAHLAGRPVPDRLAQWAHLLWRAAGAGATLMFVCGALTYWATEGGEPTADAGLDLDTAVLAALDLGTDGNP